MSKFHLKCSCIHCKQEMNVHSLKSHYSKVDAINLYDKSPILCKHCSNVLHYDKRDKVFCSNSCAASFNNKLKDYTISKPGPKPGTPNPRYIPYTKIKWCKICNHAHTRHGTTCSITCQSILVSQHTQNRIMNGWNPNTNRGRGKQSYLESSFEQWLILNDFTDYITEYHFRNHNLNKSYFVDFYFPTKNIVIELDGTQHQYTIKQDLIRDEYITSQYNCKVIRITHHEYKNQCKIDFIRAILGIQTPTN
jgi:very-short-patch-repair endonuclease